METVAMMVSSNRLDSRFFQDFVGQTFKYGYFIDFVAFYIEALWLIMVFVSDKNKPHGWIYNITQKPYQ